MAAAIPLVIDQVANKGRVTQSVTKGTVRALTGPSPPEATPAPGTQTAAVQQAADEAARRRSRSRGARSTILSQSFLSPDSPALQSTFGS